MYHHRFRTQDNGSGYKIGMINFNSILRKYLDYCCLSKPDDIKVSKIVKTAEHIFVHCIQKLERR